LRKRDSAAANRQETTRLVPSRPLSARDDLVAHVLFSCPLPALEERLLLRLLHLCDSGGKVSVAQRALAVSLRVSERSVREGLRFLEGTGVLERRRPSRPQAGEPSSCRLNARLLRRVCADWYQTQSARVAPESAREQATIGRRFLERARRRRKDDLSEPAPRAISP
jgi:hypothetical protein